MEPDVLDALRSALPWWVGLGPLLFVPLAAALSALASYVATSLALLALRGLPAGAHWTERARRAWPARVVAAAAPMLSGLVLGVLAALLSGPLTLPSEGALGVLVGIAAFAAAYPQIARVDRRCGRPLVPLRERLAGQAFVLIALYPHAWIVLVAMALMPGEPFPAALATLAVLALLLAVAAGAGLRIAAALGLARPADARVAALVEACAAKVGVRPARTWIVRWPMVNALAFARLRELAFTERAVRELSDDELSGVTAHELGHLAEPRGVLFARSLGLFALAPLILIRPLVLLSGGDPLGALPAVLALLALAIIVGRLVRRVARRMEERADAVAHAHEDDHGAYARALERIYELNLAPAVTRAKRPLHPHLYDRLVASGLTPSYPRPAPPAALPQRAAMLTLVVLVAGAAITCQIAGILAEPSEGAPPLALVALRGGSRHDLRMLGQARWEAGDLAGALPFYRALSELEPDLAHWPAETARIEAWLGLCEESARSAEEARARAETTDPAGLEALPAAVAAAERCVADSP